MEDILLFIGRLIFGGYFLLHAYYHFKETGTFARYAESKNVPHAHAAVIASGFLLLLGGYTVVVGVRVAWGVLALALFLIPTTYYMHPYWKLSGDEREAEKMKFLRNVALLGADLILLGIPTPWPISPGF